MKSTGASATKTTTAESTAAKTTAREPFTATCSAALTPTAGGMALAKTVESIFALAARLLLPVQR